MQKAYKNFTIRQRNSLTSSTPRVNLASTRKAGEGTMENQSTIKLQELNEKLITAKSLLIILETDLEQEKQDRVYQDAVKTIHKILKSAQADLEAILNQ